MRALDALLSGAWRVLRGLAPGGPPARQGFDAALRRALRRVEGAAQGLESPASADDLELDSTHRKR